VFSFSIANSPLRHAVKLDASAYREHSLSQQAAGSLPRRASWISFSASRTTRASIKAQAYQACAALGQEGRFQASIHLGPSLAEDVCRVLSEGDEA
jgi:hypothetical protein